MHFIYLNKKLNNKPNKNYKNAQKVPLYNAKLKVLTGVLFYILPLILAGLSTVLPILFVFLLFIL